MVRTMRTGDIFWQRAAVMARGFPSEAEPAAAHGVAMAILVLEHFNL